MGTRTLNFIHQSGAANLSSLDNRPELQNTMCQLVHASLAAGTWSKYASGWKAFQDFEAFVSKTFTWPLSKDTLRGFAAFCISHRKLKPASVKTYLSSLVCLHKIKGFANYEVKDGLVEAILRGADNLIMSSPITTINSRRVMTMPLLRHLGHKLSLSGWCTDTQLTIWAAVLINFLAQPGWGNF